MTEQTGNRSSRRSRRMIRQAFEALLKERGFHKITITDIVNRADLNRSTFYAHYPDIYGIVDEMQGEIVQRNMELFQKYSSATFWTIQNLIWNVLLLPWKKTCS